MSPQAFRGKLSVVPAPRTRGREEPLPAEAPLEALALKGDPAAWNALVTRHHHRVVVSLLALGIPPQRADELAQDAWAKLLQQQRAGVLAALNLPGLCVRQARFLALDDLRQRRARREDSNDEVVQRLPDPQVSVEERLNSRAQLKDLHEQLGSCGTRAQEIFLLVYREHCTHDEAATRLGISVQRVRQSLTEVRSKLRTALADEDSR
jgi:RNA polymerase sigma factor (sigma-70 family)